MDDNKAFEYFVSGRAEKDFKIMQIEIFFKEVFSLISYAHHAAKLHLEFNESANGLLPWRYKIAGEKSLLGRETKYEHSFEFIEEFNREALPLYTAHCAVGAETEEVRCYFGLSHLPSKDIWRVYDSLPELLRRLREHVFFEGNAKDLIEAGERAAKK